MAGGIDWFRWHHGSVTDPKFQLVARRSNQTLPAVIAVWAFVLEQASSADQRGSFGDIDCEAIDCMFGLGDGATSAILAAMDGRGLVAGGFVCAWDKRQPKRERVDEGNTERSRAFRQRQRQETPETDDATPCNAMQRQETPRGEESREEISANALVGGADVEAGKTPEPPEANPTEDSTPPAADPPAPPLPRCDVAAVVAAYHDILPELPAVRLMDDKRRRAIGSMWRFALTSKRSDGTPRATTADEAMAWVCGYFRRARDNDFLMGRGPKPAGHAGWQCDLDFLLTDRGKKHVIERTATHA